MTLRRLTLIGLTLCLLTPMALLAQPPDNPGNGGGNGQGNGGGILRNILPPAGYLQLTDEQKDSVKALAEDLRAALEPLRAEGQSLSEQLRDALNADSPDATTVGQLTLDLRALGRQTRDELAAFEASFREVLDAEQQTKWDNFKELRRLQRRQGGGKAKALKALKALKSLRRFSADG